MTLVCMYVCMYRYVCISGWMDVKLKNPDSPLRKISAHKQ